jgi:hypothetical protein
MRPATEAATTFGRERRLAVQTSSSSKSALASSKDVSGGGALTRTAGGRVGRPSTRVLTSWGSVADEEPEKGDAERGRLAIMAKLSEPVARD